jgi:chaperonin GroEL (HSP60 family)
MGLFGSDDDDSEEPDARGNAKPDSDRIEQPDPRVAARVDAVFDATDQRAETERLVADLDGRERVTAARALGRVVVKDPGAIGDETVESAIEALATRDRARAIADGALHQAEALRWSGVGPTTIAEGALDALGVALREVESLRTDGGTVPAGGGAETEIARRVREHADGVAGRVQLVHEMTADAFERVPKLLARRAETDPVDAIVDLRVAGQRGEPMALDVESGQLIQPSAPGGSIETAELSARLVDGITLAVVVLIDRGTVAQLESLTGHPAWA